MNKGVCISNDKSPLILMANCSNDSNDYEEPTRLRTSEPHIYEDRLVHNSHIYIECTGSSNSNNRNDCDYICPRNDYNDIIFYRDPITAREPSRNKLKARLLVILSFFCGIVLGTSVTVAILLSLHQKCQHQSPETKFESPPGNKTFNTSEEYSFRVLRCEIGDAPFKDHFINFSVKACSDAYLVLTSEYDDSGPLVEIALGINGDTRSAIRTEKGGENKVEYVSPQILNCRLFQRFWINWQSNKIEVGIDVFDKSNIFLTFVDDRDLNFVNIGISTGIGSRGEWLFTKA